MAETSWYKVVQNEEELEHGDIILTSQYHSTPIYTKDLDFDITYVDNPVEVIVATHMCDLASGQKNDVNSVLVFPVITWEELKKKGDEFGESFAERVRRHIEVGWFILDSKIVDPCKRDFSFVSLRQPCVVDRQMLESDAKQMNSRLRLISPLRESFSYNVARLFLRSGLDRQFEIPQFKGAAGAAKERAAQAFKALSPEEKTAFIDERKSLGTPYQKKNKPP